MIETEPRQPVRAIVASFLFTDLVGFSKGSATEQYAAKATLSACLRSNLAALRETDYWLKDTGDGALIAFVSNPEHALYMALAIAQQYGHGAGTAARANDLRTGLHLGTVKETIDIEARPNYIGDGINATKRIMDFAAPGQIAASRNFFEAVANLDTEYAALFQHVGASDDKHGRAHELYAIAPSAEVLSKLRLDLAETTARPVESGANRVAAIGEKRDPSAAVSTKSTTPSHHAAAVAARMGSKPIIVLFVVMGLAAATALTMWRPGPAAVSVEPVITKSLDDPMPAQGPPVSPASTAGPTSPVPTAPIVAPGFDESTPVSTTHAAQDEPTSESTSPVIVAPKAAAKANIERTAKASASPAAPVRAPVASDHDSLRCSKIVEKAALGEPLSQEEKKELANSCR